MSDSRPEPGEPQGGVEAGAPGLPAAEPRDGGVIPPLVALSLGQLLSWGMLYYGITFLAAPVHHDTGWGLASIFGAFSMALLIAGLAAPWAGASIARHGGRRVMTAGTLLAAGAFVIIANAPSMPWFFVGWAMAGLAMSMTLYEAAFSTLRELPERLFRRLVGVVTVFGGLASTAAWPATYWLVGLIGWRSTLLVFAGVHLILCAPMYWAMLPATRRAAPPPGTLNPTPPARQATNAERRVLWLLGISFAASTLIAAAVSAHIGLIVADRGVPDALMLSALALIGPMQVVARALDILYGGRAPLLGVGLGALAALALCMLILLWLAAVPWLLFLFAVAYGASNGLMTVVRGLAPAELLKGHGYAATLGKLAAPALVARSVGPILAAAVIARWGVDATLLLLCGVGALGWVTFRWAARRGG